MVELTNKQRRVFAFIDEQLGAGKLCPSREEIRRHFGFRSPRAVADHVAALIDDESTLKTFIRKNGKPYLKAENARYPDLIPSADLTIQGVFRGLIRRAEK